MFLMRRGGILLGVFRWGGCERANRRGLGEGRVVYYGVGGETWVEKDADVVGNCVYCIDFVNTCIIRDVQMFHHAVVSTLMHFVTTVSLPIIR